MFRHVLTDEFLEEKWTLLHDGMHLASDEDASVDILLSQLAESLVLGHDSLVDIVDESEVFVGGILVSEDFVAYQRVLRSTGDKSLCEKEMGSAAR